ncbi:MAG: sugar phosphate isomerase/epimerase [Kiritimatiellae bacterium]|nr:sugar phosphate isomerase/epimerase [Kiritimatiellia bacterium]MDD5522546.1 sugar phosphate isomerase/epimerase [Kiritimatiellia bacterium]
MLNRRSFLKGAVSGVGGFWSLALCSKSTADNAPVKPNAAGQQRMKLSIDSTMFSRFKTPAVWTMIREAGYRFIELGICHFRSHEIDSGAIQQLKKDVMDAGLSPVAAFIVHRFSSPDETIRKKAVENWKRSIDAVGQLGLKLITTELTGELKQPAQSETAFRKSMEVLLPVLEKVDIHLSVEPHPGDFFEAAKPTIKLLRSYNSKCLGYLHCMPHDFFLGNPREVILDAGRLLSHVHVADTFRRERLIAKAGIGLHMHLRPPLGEVNFQETFDALEKIGYRGCASVQLLSHLDDPGGTARQTREYLQKTYPDCFVI